MQADGISHEVLNRQEPVLVLNKQPVEYLSLQDEHFRTYAVVKSKNSKVGTSILAVNKPKPNVIDVGIVDGTRQEDKTDQSIQTFIVSSQTKDLVTKPVDDLSRTITKKTHNPMVSTRISHQNGEYDISTLGIADTMTVAFVTLPEGGYRIMPLHFDPNRPRIDGSGNFILNQFIEEPFRLKEGTILLTASKAGFENLVGILGIKNQSFINEDKTPMERIGGIRELRYDLDPLVYLINQVGTDAALNGVIRELGKTEGNAEDFSVAFTVFGGKKDSLDTAELTSPVSSLLEQYRSKKSAEISGPAKEKELNQEILISHHETQNIRVDNSHIATMGMVRSADMGTIGEDLIAIKKGNESMKTIILDGPPKQDADKRAQERSYLEKFSQEILETDFRKLTTQRENARPLVSTEITYVEKADKYVVYSLGIGDVTLLALKKDIRGKFSADLIDPIHVELRNTSSPIYLIDKPFDMQKLQPTPRILDKGTVIVSFSDGGLEALLNYFKNYDKALVDSPEKLSAEEIKLRLVARMEPLVNYLNQNPDLAQSIPALLQSLNDRQYTSDDAAVLFTILDKLPETKKTFSSDIQPLMEYLNQPGDIVDMDPRRTVERFGKEICARLVKELIDMDYTGGSFFVKACALVRPDELDSTILEWFKKKNLKILDNEDIIVYQNLKKGDPDNTRACFEIGQMVIDGNALGQNYTLDHMDIPPKYISPQKLQFHEKDEAFPRGRIAVVTKFDKKQLTVVGCPIAGNGPRARGILMPSDGADGSLYHSNEESYIAGGHRKFFIADRGIDREMSWAAQGITLYLMRVIDSKEDHISKGGHAYFEGR